MRNMLLFLTLLGGCSVPTSRTYRIDASLVDHADVVVDGLSAWQALGMRFELDDASSFVVRCATLDTEYAGFTDNTGIRVDCAWLESVGPDFQRELFMHEGGHATGLQHLSDVNSVMYPYITDTKSFSALDVQEYHRTH